MSRYNHNDYCDRDEPSCEGRAVGCKGCECCVKEVRSTSYSVARKARAGVRVGDLVARTTGFDYQIGGPRLGYIKPVTRVLGFGPNAAPALVGFGWPSNVARTFALPPEAVERERLRAAVREVRSARHSNLTVETATAMHERAVALRAECEAFLVNAPSLRTYIVGERWEGDIVTLTAETVKGVQARAERERLVASWNATGGSWKREGERITFGGREYVLGERWTKWVAHSNMEYMGESVDGEVVSGRSLLCPDTGNVLLRWSDKSAYPA
jgi:hypothetical protein